jgi:signal transduction histidine kinase/ligand-binding sensor domain-containing protein
VTSRWRASRAPAAFEAHYRRFHRLVALSFLFALASRSAQAVDPAKQISQYAHGVWRTREGLIAGIPSVIAQTSDGYLWIGTNIGLTRFDGAKFTNWDPPNGQKLSDPRVFSLLADREGSLWIGTGYDLERLKNGVLTRFRQATGRIESITEDNAGTVWFVRTQATDEQGPLCSIQEDKIRCYRARDGVPFPMAIRVLSGTQSELWIAGYDALCRWTQTSAITWFAGGPPHSETFASLKGLAKTPDGSIWAAKDRHSRTLELDQFQRGIWLKRDYPSIPVHNADISALFIDREDGLWIGTLHEGIWRIRKRQVDHFGSADGLSGDWVSNFFEDAEGTIWVATSEGIDNFRDLPVTSITTREGLSADGATAITASRDGTVWVANFESLDALRNTGISKIRTGHGLPGINITTLLEDHAMRLWLGIDNGLWVYDHGKFQTIHGPNRRPLGIVFAIAEDTRHRIWVRAGPNLDCIDDLRLTSVTTSPQIANAYTLAADPRGGLIMGLVNGDLIGYADGQIRILSPAVGSGGAHQVRDLLVDADGSAWGTTLDGVFFARNGVRISLTSRNGLPCDEVFGIIKDKNDALWLYSRCGLISISKSQWRRWQATPGTSIKFDLLGTLCGVYPGLTSLKPQTAITPDGRLWFVNDQIVQVIDPAHPLVNSRPPPIKIQAVVADDRSYSTSGLVKLPPRTRDLEIDYAALSYVAPERVRFRYKLEDFDRDWHEASDRRHASYFNIPPGKYTFRVLACNNSGVWDTRGAALSIVILPAWNQTRWFRLASLISAILLGYGVYWLRIRQREQSLKIRFSERIDERTRIARELHDTLLQDFHGLMFRFQAARNLMPERFESAMKVLDEAILATEKALAQGREAIHDLRPPPAAIRNLADLLRAAGEDLLSSYAAHGAPEQFRVIAEGKPREISERLLGEIYRIGRELIANAFRHATASRVELEILYGETQLRLRVRDDGKGIDRNDMEIIKRSGHWGLAGIRERAQRIGASLEFWSEEGAGTEVEVTVPSSLAYERTRRHRSKLSHRAGRWGFGA